MSKETPAKSSHAEREERILSYWKEKGIFEKSLAKDAPKGEYTFYDGPPFATGTPHYGHILASAIKDAVPRYWTMRGYRVPRRWGWDCHGLPIENIVENDLKISGKKQIEEYGVGKFNEYARSKVLGYVHEWKKTVERMGRWVDFDGSYKTMDNTYIESVWWAFKELYGKELIYEGTKVLPYCPRCETPIANSEIAMDNSYKDIKDISVYVKFQIKGQADTFLLAWTTTPWTLPGNFALAVNPSIDYVKIKAADSFLIVAKDRLAALKDGPYEVVETIPGKKLVGLSYEPLFPYFTGREFKDKANAWKVYAADFVTTTDGTGIVHIAPGYGEDDMRLANKENIPFIHHVTHNGRFTADVADFADLPIKPKDTKEEPEKHLQTDIQIVRHLDGRKLLFAKENIRHSYPHCYRCETPLYYYAIPAWFVRISAVKSRLLELNQDINWIPEHLKAGRFGKSMEGAPDWNISRNRFWASPLPIWRCEGCKATKIVGSLEDIKAANKPRNTYYVMRHGEAENNVRNILSCDAQAPHHLTPKGRKQVEDTASTLKGIKFDLVYASPFVRTEETMEIVHKQLGWDKSIIHIDDRLREMGTGTWNGKDAGEYGKIYPYSRRFDAPPEGGESYLDIKKRVGDFLYEIDAQNEGKTILIVTHETPASLLISAARGLDREQTVAFFGGDDLIQNAEVRKVGFTPMPHNAEYALDLHRPYIDAVSFACACGGEMKRVSEVMDCWFESGSMPFAAEHYPFENKDWIKKHLPAQFVAEYIAQTRTWFYYMHVLSTILFDRAPFENVVTTGTVLAEDGQKMSKSKNNFPDPAIVFDRYGADAVRYYLLSSPLMKSEDLNFCEKDVDEVGKKLISRLTNVLAFYELYADAAVQPSSDSSHVLDRWIISRLNQVIVEVTLAMNAYELDKATRPFMDFVDDLSTWYVRRSRERFKGDDEADKQAALATTRFVLTELSKVLAPFTPFLAEEIYRRVGGGLESVHLESWPEGGKTDEKILAAMETVRSIASKGLEARMTVKINVRQPLAALASGTVLPSALVGLLKDEVNVKEFIFKESLGVNVELNTQLTPELKEEGDLRELLRKIQDLRKEKGLSVKDKAVLVATADLKALIGKHEATIKGATNLSAVEFGDTLGIK